MTSSSATGLRIVVGMGARSGVALVLLRVVVVLLLKLLMLRELGLSVDVASSAEVGVAVLLVRSERVVLTSAAGE